MRHSTIHYSKNSRVPGRATIDISCSFKGPPRSGASDTRRATHTCFDTLGRRGPGRAMLNMSVISKSCGPEASDAQHRKKCRCSSGRATGDATPDRIAVIENGGGE
ncbi:MAG: hypothetical protein JXA30_11670 [Deltaproteobacteria bacterium]|nr:hypothetical protein [Deltaproteobacteria bacterium]